MRAIGRFLTDVAVVASLLICALIVMNVVLRGVGLGALPDLIHIVEEAMVFAVALPLAMVSIRHSHICVTLISSMLPRRVEAGLVVFGALFGLAATAPLLWAAYGAFLADWKSGAYAFGDLDIPKWPGRLVFVLGLLAMVIATVLRMVTDLNGKTDPLAPPSEDI